MKAIFMVGEQRSGSNLLRLILNESPDIAAPHPPHILERLMPVVNDMFDFEDTLNFRQLIDKVCQMVEANPVEWEKVVFDREEIFSRCKARNLIAIYDAIMATYAEAHDAKMWLCKSMQNIRWADELDAHFKDPKYIYLYRDPRDVCLSFMKAVVGEKHPYFIAKKWVELQKLCIDYRNSARREQLFSLCYEDLLDNPERYVTALCSFLGIEFKPEMLAFHKSNEASNAARSSKLWANVSQPIMRSNRGKFAKELSKNDIEIIESIAGDVMDILGYERLYTRQGKVRRFNSTEIATYAMENDRLRGNVEARTDREDVRRRQRQARVVNEIRQLVNELNLSHQVA